jgi:hypothetical protein
MEVSHNVENTVKIALLLVVTSVALVSERTMANGSSSVEVTVTNLTRGQIISPVVIASHSRHFVPLFELGSEASEELANVAEEAVHYSPAYDAGSEANNENCRFIPGPPCGRPLVRAEKDAEGYVHVHAGIYGGGHLVPGEHDWRNPVARIRIRRRRGH